MWRYQHDVPVTSFGGTTYTSIKQIDAFLLFIACGTINHSINYTSAIVIQIGFEVKFTLHYICIYALQWNEIYP
jgi:hypothetical protein